MLDLISSHSRTKAMNSVSLISFLYYSKIILWHKKVKKEISYIQKMYLWKHIHAIAKELIPQLDIYKPSETFESIIISLYFMRFINVLSCRYTSIKIKFSYNTISCRYTSNCQWGMNVFTAVFWIIFILKIVWSKSFSHSFDEWFLSVCFELELEFHKEHLGHFHFFGSFTNYYLV